MTDADPRFRNFDIEDQGGPAALATVDAYTSTPAALAPAAPALLAPRPAASEGFAAQLGLALAGAWEAIRARHGELPAAVLIVASAGSGKARSWGHWAASRWDVDGTRVGEVMVAGELVAPGGGNYPELPAPARLLSTLLHEAAHALAHARGTKDTSRGGRYHNAKYRELAEEVGLAVEASQTYGWCLTRATEATLLEYAQVLAALARALRGFRGGEPEAEANPKKASGGLLKATCACERSIRVARGTLEAGPITCGVCGEAFQAPEEEGADEGAEGDEA